MPDFVGVLVGFARALRAEGVAAGTGDAEVFCASAACLDPTDLVDLYWAGRCSLVTRHADLPVYDDVFRRYFLGGSVEAVAEVRTAQVGVAATFSVPVVEPGAAEAPRQSLGLAASTVDVSRQRAFAECTPAELAALRRILARLRLVPPRRRTRRMEPAPAGGSSKASGVTS